MNDITSKNAVVAIYKSHPEAENAIKELQRSGFDMEQLSIVGRDCHTEEHVVGYYTTGDRMRYGESRAPFGAGFGRCCSVRRSFGFRASGRCWWRGRWSL